MGSRLNLDIVENKRYLRKKYQKKRRAIPLEKKLMMREEVARKILLEVQNESYVCSFISKSEEIDLSYLNDKLARYRKLLLPRISGEEIEIFFVEDMEHDLEKGPFSLFQPKPSCQKFLSPLPCVLVPALVLDKNGYRLGFGYGFYDRLLQAHPYAFSIGIGFLEQLSSEDLPIEPHDQKVQKILLF